MMPRLARILPMLAILSLAPPAMAQTPATPAPATTEPERSVAVFGDWSMRCEGRPPARACEVTQTLQNDRAQPVAVFAVGRATRTDPLKLIVQLPLNVAIPTAPRLVLDGGNTSGTPLALTWRQCIPAGCYAEVALTDAPLLNRLRARELPGRIVFQQASGGEATLPFSFRGLAAALDAVPRD